MLHVVSRFRPVTFALRPCLGSPAHAVASLDGLGYRVVVPQSDWGAVREGMFLLPGTIVPTSRAPFDRLPSNVEHPTGGPGHRVRAQRIGGEMSDGLLVPITDTIREMRAAGVSAEELARHYGVLPVPAEPAPEGLPAPPTFPAAPTLLDARDFPEALTAMETVRVTEWLAGTPWRVGFVLTSEGPRYVVGGAGPSLLNPVGLSLPARAAAALLPMPLLTRCLIRWVERTRRETGVRDPFAHFARQFVVYGSITGDSPPTATLTDLFVDDTWRPRDELLALAREVALEVSPVLYRGRYDPALRALADRLSAVTPPGARPADGIVLTAEPEGTFEGKRREVVVPSDAYLLTI